VSPVKYELGFYIPEDTILHGHSRENLKSYRIWKVWLRLSMLVFQDFTDRTAFFTVIAHDSPIYSIVTTVTVSTNKIILS
jgi:hypothetical protein